LYYGANQARLYRAYLEYLRWGGFLQLKDLDDEESRCRYIKEVVVEKILRYDLPARFSDGHFQYTRFFRPVNSEGACFFAVKRMHFV
jgi:hypothetical protein